jgi:hypothetical protein
MAYVHIGYCIEHYRLSSLTVPAQRATTPDENVKTAISNPSKHHTATACYLKDEERDCANVID